MNFENFENHLDFVCQPTSLTPAIRPDSTRCTAPEVQYNKGNRIRFMKLLSQDNLPTAPWRLLLSFPSLFLYITLAR